VLKLRFAKNAVVPMRGTTVAELRIVYSLLPEGPAVFMCSFAQGKDEFLSESE
jgi:hypothetical protein